MKYCTEKERADFSHAQKIWEKYKGQTAQFRVTCWEGNPVHTVYVVEPPDPKKAPRRRGFFPEIGFFGIGSTYPPSGRGHTSVPLSVLEEV